MIEDSDSGSSTSSSDWDNDTYISEPWFSSPLHTPKAPRHTRHGNWHEGGVESSISAIDSMAQLAERRQALRAQADGVQARQRGVRGRHTESKQDERDRRQQILSLRNDYERRVEQFREERAELFSPHDELKGGSYIATQAMEAGAATNFSEVSRQPLQEGAGPSRGPQRRRHVAEQTVTSKLHQRDNANAAANLNGPFVLVAMRVPKLGPCGTLVIDHDTGMEMLETRRYRVRADELQSIDEDGDSAMGSDEYYVCDSSTI